MKNTEATIYEVLSAQKDCLHTICNRMKMRWTRPVWERLHTLCAVSDYLGVRALVLEQRPSKTRATALECVDTIIRLSARLGLAY